MSDFDDFDFEEEPPRMARSSRLVLDPVHITGGEDGGVEMGTGASRIELGEEVDADAPIEAVPKGPAQRPDYQTGMRLEDEGRRRDEERGGRATRIERRDEVADAGPAGGLIDALVSMGTVQIPGRQSGAQRRTQERGQQFVDQFTSGDASLGGRNPIDPIIGRDERGNAPLLAARGALSLGFDDELEGAASSMLGRDTYEGARDRSRAQSARAQEQAPDTSTMGAIAGSLPFLALPGASQASATVGLPARAALATGQGAQLGGMAAFGNSDADLWGENAEPERLAQETAGGAAAGGGMGLLGELAGSGLTAAREGPTPDPAARDQALLGATGNAGGTIGRGPGQAFDFGDSHDAIMRSRARAAQVLRDTHAVPAIAGPVGTRESIQRAMEGVTGTMDDVRTAMGARGPTGEQVAERLRARTAGMDSPTGQQTRQVLEDFAERYGGVLDDAPASGAGGARLGPQALPGHRPPSQPIDYDALMRDLRNLRSSGAWRTRAGQDVPLSQQGQREVDRELRAVFDDAIESELAAAPQGGYRGREVSPAQQEARARLGDDPVGAYRQSRQRYPVLDTALENARDAEARAAQHRPMGLSEFGWGAAGGSAGAAVAGAPGAMLGSALGAGASRAWRAIEPRARATGANLLHDLARDYPRGLTRALPLEEAGGAARLGGRGTPFFEAATGDGPSAQPEPVEAAPEAAEEPPAADEWADFDFEEAP